VFFKNNFKAKTPEIEVERQLAKSDFNFWDKDLIRNKLEHTREKEYVPIRMIDF
jgi:hypothetical protein